MGKKGQQCHATSPTTQTAPVASLAAGDVQRLHRRPPIVRGEAPVVVFPESDSESYFDQYLKEGAGCDRNAEGMASILRLPAELLSDIFDHLTPTDIKNLTLCCKWQTCRSEALRRLMKRVVLTEEAARAFEDGGPMERLRGYASHICIGGLSQRGLHVDDKRRILSTLLDALPLFHNVTSISLGMACTYVMAHTVFLNSVLHGLTRVANPPNLLREIETTMIRDLRIKHEDEAIWVMTPGTRCGLLAREVFEADERHGRKSVEDPDCVPNYIVYPPSLETLTLNLPHEIWVFRQRYQRSYITPASLPTALKNLKIVCKQYQSRIPPTYDTRTNTIRFGENEMYHHIKRLEFRTEQEIGMTCLWEIIHLFPGLEEFVLGCEDGFANTFEYHGVAYYTLHRLKHLKRITLPHPRHKTSNLRLNELTYDCPKSEFYNEARLARTVRDFLSRGMTALEQVQFCRRVIEDIPADELDGRILQYCPPMSRYSDYDRDPPRRGMLKRKCWKWTECRVRSRDDIQWREWCEIGPVSGPISECY